MGLKHQRRTSDSALFPLSLNTSARFSIRKFAPKLPSELLINLALILVQNLRWKHLSSLFSINTILSANLGSSIASGIFIRLLVSPLFHFNLSDGQGHGLDLRVHSRGQNKCVRP